MLMNNIARLTQKRRLLVFGMMLAVVAIAVIANSVLQVAADGPGVAPNAGIICTENTTSTFTISAKTGYINMADGNQVFMWSYAEGKDDFQYPGPILCVQEGDTVTIVLHNQLPEDTSIVFPGQMDVLANGTPVEAQFDAQGAMNSFAQVAPANGGTMTYSFVAEEPGTYVYQSGTNPALQTQMGLFGALVIRPAMAAPFDPNLPADKQPVLAYNDATTAYNPDTEYMMMLSEIDPLLHRAVELGQPFDMNDYNARYYLINGRTFPDTLAPNYASWLPNQPYSSLAHIYPFNDNATLGNGDPNPAYYPYPALDRFVGMGVESYPFHPHAFNAQIIARDGRLLQTSGGDDLYEERFSLPISPGQTSDAFYTFTDVYMWNPDAQPGDADEFPVQLPGQQNLPSGLFYGSPFLGNQDTRPVGDVSFNQCGEFYHIAHNHNLQQITGWGVVLIGQITFTRIDPPLPNNCP
jgi:FtsP/CotA-like multicopper oxidase with cupredoxin domain